MTDHRVIDPEVPDVPTLHPSPSTHATPIDGPPPPPARAGSDGESRSTAAGWVAAVGAALLLAAAGTFLAVSWDALDLTARVAVVAGVTGAAILGGHRLRRSLPAVGTVVFHLGALLLPVDALGLAYQLDASVAARWAAVGLTAAVALPLLAVVGRSRILGFAGLAGVPVAATAAGIAGLAPAAAVLVGLAVLALVVEVARGSAAGDVAPGEHRALAPVVAPVVAPLVPVLAFAAVAIPLGFALAAWFVAPGTVLGSAALAWTAGSWHVPALVGVTAVVALAAVATRRHDPAVAALAVVAAVFATIGTVLPPATPRAVLLLAPAVAWLLAETAALAGRDHRLWAAPMRIVANLLEGVAVLVGLRALAVLLLPAGWLGQVPDPALAAQTITLAAGWGMAAVRRGGPGRQAGSAGGGVSGAGGAFAVGALTVAVVHLAAASRDLASSVEVAGAILVAGSIATLGVLLGAGRRGTAPAAGSPAAAPAATPVGPAAPAAAIPAGPAAPAVATPAGPAVSSSTSSAASTSASARWLAPFMAVVLLAVATVVLVGSPLVALVVVAVPVVLAVHLAAALRRDVHAAAPLTAAPLTAAPLTAAPLTAAPLTAAPLTAAVLLLGVPLLGWSAAVMEGLGRWPVGVAALVAGCGLLGLASAVDRLEPAADSLRAIALVVGLVITVPAWGGGSLPAGGDTLALWGALGLRVVPGAAVPAAVIGAWLVADAVRRRSLTIAVLAVPVVLRAAAGGMLAAGATFGAVGAVLLVVAIASAGVAVMGPRDLLAPSLTAAAIAGPLGWLFIGDAPSLRAAVLVVAGLVVVGVGVVRRRPLVAHLGGLLATVGVWQLLTLAAVTSLDVWLLPVALQLAVAGESARRRGTSSWVAFVPPLLLVAVPAIAERLGGGPGWHALLAGGVGVLAVVAGGARRLGGPLVVGTLVVVVVVGIETFAIVADVPTWVWLAVGGIALLGAAALIERLGGSPVRAVRRAVDVVGERFA